MRSFRTTNPGGIALVRIFPENSTGSAGPANRIFRHDLTDKQPYAIESLILPSKHLQVFRGLVHAGVEKFFRWFCPTISLPLICSLPLIETQKQQCRPGVR